MKRLLRRIKKKYRRMIDACIWNISKAELFEVGEYTFFQNPFYVLGGEYIKIGKHVYAARGLQIEAWDKHNGVDFSPEIFIGDNVNINPNCHIGCINHIYIGNNVLIGSRVCIIDHDHGEDTEENYLKAPNDRILFSKGEVIIEDNCWIGEACIILPGVRIGKNSIIGAGSVVTKDIPEGSIAVGNPAVVKRCRAGFED